MALCLRCPSRLLERAGTQLAAAFQARNLTDKEASDIELPAEPTTCCMSGCANCVWIDYATTVANMLGENDERARQIVLDKIEDPNLKMFLSMELRHLKQLRESKTKNAEEQGNPTEDSPK